MEIAETVVSCRQVKRKRKKTTRERSLDRTQGAANLVNKANKEIKKEWKNNDASPFFFFFYLFFNFFFCLVFATPVYNAFRRGNNSILCVYCCLLLRGSDNCILLFSQKRG